jgi:DNA-binding IclR family transcriptional regulator
MKSASTSGDGVPQFKVLDAPSAATGLSPEPGESMIARVSRILETFDRYTPAMTLSELSRRADLPLPTTYRLVKEMVRHGLLDRDEDLQIRIGLRLWELTSRSSVVLDLREIALPHMEALQVLTGEVVALAILEDDSALYVERLSDAGVELAAGRMAERHPLTATSTGLVLIAYGSMQLQQRVLASGSVTIGSTTISGEANLRRFFANIRQQGHAYFPGLGRPDWVGMAVPIFDRTRQAVASLSIVYPIHKARPERGFEPLLKAAKEISTALAVNRETTSG